MMEVDEFWEENNAVCYEKYGATIKVPKSNIERIEHSEAEEIKDTSNDELTIAGIENTEELKAIEKQCKKSCEDEYEKCAYRCLKNTDDNSSATNCKSECRSKAKNCKWVCKDDFRKNNLAFLKYEYQNSEKPIDEPYTMIGPTKSQLLESDKGRIKYHERKLRESIKRGQKYWEDKFRGGQPTWYCYNQDVYRREIELLEAKKRYDLHKYGKRVSGSEYHRYINKLRSEQSQ